jgi:hypothetical protein
MILAEFGDFAMMRTMQLSIKAGPKPAPSAKPRVPDRLRPSPGVTLDGVPGPLGGARR